MTMLDIDIWKFGFPSLCHIGVPSPWLETHFIRVSIFFYFSDTFSIKIQKEATVCTKTRHLVGVPVDCKTVANAQSPPIMVVIVNIFLGWGEIKV